MQSSLTPKIFRTLTTAAAIAALSFLTSCGCGPGEVKVGINGGSVCMPEEGGLSGRLLIIVVLIGAAAVLFGSRSK